MSLDEYERKRKFSDTPEPKPSTKGKQSAGGGNYFCVQRHDATRLHYDFRLEIGGTLKSWAVPKGPTLDPSIKHLAAHVEDHPLEYGDFEGNIPEGNYGAGSVMLWDRGTYELVGDRPAEEQYERGDLKFRLHGEKLAGEFALVRMKGRGKGNDWLIIKKHDAAAVPGWDIEDYAYSVLSGRTQEEIAQNPPAHKSKRKTAGESGRVWESDRPATRKRSSSRRETAPAPPRDRADPSGLKGAVKAPMPAKLVPMKATLVDKPPRGPDWLFEIKWDGVRAVCFIDNERLRIMSRNGIFCEKQYPELAVVPRYIAAAQAILDGEIVVLDEKGVSRFALIQPRISNTDPNTIAHLARAQPVTLFAFDLLYLDGYDLRQVSLVERKQLLEGILTPAPVLKYSGHFPGAGDDMLNAAREHGLEGIVAKHAPSCYEPRRSREWLKLKVVAQQEFVIGGFTVGERDYFSSLALGVWEKGELVYVGNVGTGFDRWKLEQIYNRLKPLITARRPFAEKPGISRKVTWVRPEVVCEVKFSNWTQDGKLRAPVFLGLREDVDSGNVAREKAEGADPLPAGEADTETVSIEGKRLKFTHLKKVFYPADGYTKGDVIRYYDSVAPLLLPHLKDRPLSLKRYPDGIDGEFFFQKDITRSWAKWLHTEEIYAENIEGMTRYVIAGDRATLLYLANLACIDQNPWLSRVGSLENPDFVLIDLDPHECPYEMIVEAALLVRRTLETIKLDGYPKTTGGGGMHIYVPVEPVYTYEQTKSFAELLANIVIAERPDLFTTPRRVAKRTKGRVYFDYLQNGKAKTIAAPYVPRAYAGAPVSTPLRWEEVKPGLSPGQFHIRNARERFDRVGDLFAPVLAKPQRLEEPLERLASLIKRTQAPASRRA